MAKTARSMAAALTKAAQKIAAAAMKSTKAKAAKTTARPSPAAVKSRKKPTAVKKKTQLPKAKTTSASALPQLFPTAKKQNDAPSPIRFGKRTPQNTSGTKGRTTLKGMAKADLGKTLGSAVRNPVTAQYLPLSDDYRISSKYGVDRVTHRHSGIDLAVAEGTKVAAVKTGTVSFAGWGNGYGYRVVIDHPDGTQTTYNHLSDIGVKPGDHVLAGRAIALSGNTGNSTGPHLHFEVKKDGRYVDPELYFDFGNGLKSADTAYTSQMSNVAKAANNASSSGSSRAIGSAGSGRKKAKSGAALPNMEFTAVSAGALPTLPTAQTPTITAYKSNARLAAADFQNPLTLLVPSYRHRTLRTQPRHLR